MVALLLLRMLLVWFPGVTLPTPRLTLRDSSAQVLVWCKACRHRAEADLQKLVDEGRGDVPLIHLPFRCRCGSRRTGMTQRRCSCRTVRRNGLTTRPFLLADILPFACRHAQRRHRGTNGHATR